MPGEQLSFNLNEQPEPEAVVAHPPVNEPPAENPVAHQEHLFPVDDIPTVHEIAGREAIENSRQLIRNFRDRRVQRPNSDYGKVNQEDAIKALNKLKEHIKKMHERRRNGE